MLKHIQGILQTVWKQKSLTKSQPKHVGGNTKSRKKKSAINSQLIIPATNNEKYNVNTSQEIMELKKTYDMIMKKFVNPRLDLMTSNRTMLQQMKLLKLSGKDLFDSISSSFFGVKRQTAKELTASDEKYSEADKSSKRSEPTFGWLGQPVEEMASKPTVEVSSLPLDIESAFFVFPEEGKVHQRPKKRHLKRNALPKPEKYPISTDSYKKYGSLDLIKYIPKSKIETFYELNAQKQKLNEMSGSQDKNDSKLFPSNINESTECSVNCFEESCNVQNRTQADNLDVIPTSNENDMNAKEKYDEAMKNNLIEQDFGKKLENHLLGNNTVGSYTHLNTTDEKGHVNEETLLNTDHGNINFNKNEVVRANRSHSGHGKKKRKKSQNKRLNELTNSKDDTIYNSPKQSGLVNTGALYNKPHVNKSNTELGKSETRKNNEQALNSSPSKLKNNVSNMNNLEVISNNDILLKQQQHKRKHQVDKIQGKVLNKSQKDNNNKTVVTKQIKIKAKNKKQGRTTKIEENGTAVLSDYLKYVKNKAWYYSQDLKVKENNYNSNSLIDISKNELEANQSKNDGKNKLFRAKSLPNLRDNINISLTGATGHVIKSKTSLNPSKYKSGSSLPVQNHVALTQINKKNLPSKRSKPKITENADISDNTMMSKNSITHYNPKFKTTSSTTLGKPNPSLTIANLSTTSSIDKKRKMKEVLEKKKIEVLENIDKNNTFPKIVYNSKNRKLHTKKQQNTITNLKMYGAESSNITSDLKSVKSVEIVVKKEPSHSKQICTTNFSTTVKKSPIKRNNEPSIQIADVFSKRMQTRNLFTIEHNTTIVFNYFCKRYATTLANESNTKESAKVKDKYITLFKVKPMKHKTIIGNFSNYNNLTEEATAISKIGTTSKVNTADEPLVSKIIESRKTNVFREKHADINSGSGKQLPLSDNNYKLQHKNNISTITYINKKSNIIRQSDNYKNALVQKVHDGNKQKTNNNKLFNSSNQDDTNVVQTTPSASASGSRNKHEAESVRSDILSPVLNTTNINNSNTSPIEKNRDAGIKAQSTTEIDKTSKSSEENFNNSYLSSALHKTWKCKTDRLINWADKVPRSNEACIKRKTQIRSVNNKNSTSDNIFGVLNNENKSTNTEKEKVQKEEVNEKNNSEQSNTTKLIYSAEKMLFPKDKDRALSFNGTQVRKSRLKDNSIKPIEKISIANLNKCQINSPRNKSYLESGSLVGTESKHGHCQINCQNNFNSNPKNRNISNANNFDLNQEYKHKNNRSKALKGEYYINRNSLEDVENQQVENAYKIETKSMGENKNQIMDTSVLFNTNLKRSMNKCREQNVLLPALNTDIVLGNTKQNVKNILEPKKSSENESFSALTKLNIKISDDNTDCSMLLESKNVNKTPLKNSMLHLKDNIYKNRNNKILENNSTTNNKLNYITDKYILEVQDKNVIPRPTSSKRTNKSKIQTQTLQRENQNQQKTKPDYQRELKVNKIELNNYSNLSELQPISKNKILTCSLNNASCHNSDTFIDNIYGVGSQTQDFVLPITLQKSINTVNKHIVGTPKTINIVKNENKNNVKKNYQHPIMENRKINVIGKEHVKHLDNQKLNDAKNMLNNKGSNDSGNKMSNTFSQRSWDTEAVPNPNTLFIEKYQPPNDIKKTFTAHPIEKEGVIIKFPLTIKLPTGSESSKTADDSNKIFKLDHIKNGLCKVSKEKHNRINLEPLKFNENLVNIIKESKSGKPQRRITMMK